MAMNAPQQPGGQNINAPVVVNATLANQQVANAGNATGAAMPNPATRPATGLRSPRWPLLAAQFCLLLTCAGYGLLYTFPCASHPQFILCQVSSWHPAVQMGLLLVTFLLTWPVFWVFGASVAEPQIHRSYTSTFLRQLSDFVALRPLVLLSGGVALVVGALMVLFNHFYPVPCALALILIFVALWVRFYREPLPQVDPHAQVQAQQNQTPTRVNTWLFRLRSLPLIRGITPP